jgi:hypothetical protein
MSPPLRFLHKSCVGYLTKQNPPKDHARHLALLQQKLLAEASPIWRATWAALV